MSSQREHSPSTTRSEWTIVNNDMKTLKELQKVMEAAWYFLAAYAYVNTEIISVMKCTKRLAHLFLSDPQNKDIYKYSSHYSLKMRRKTFTWTISILLKRCNFVPIEQVS